MCERENWPNQGLSKPIAKPPWGFCPVGARPHKLLPAFAEAEPVDTAQCYATKIALAHTSIQARRELVQLWKIKTKQQGC